MPEYEIHRQVPAWIERGLEDGSLRKGTGGVIRHAFGINKDRVTAIIRSPSTNGSPLKIDRPGHPFGAVTDPIEARVPLPRPAGTADAERRAEVTDTVAQIAGAVDLYVSEIGPGSIAAVDVIGDMLFGLALARIDGHLQLLQRGVSATLELVGQSLAALRDLGDLQVVGFTTEVGRGVELLQRGVTSGDREYFVRAAERLEEGIADIKTVLQTTSGEQMLENAFRTRHLLRVAALCASGEMQAMALADSSFERRIASLEAHRELWKLVFGRLRDTPGPAFRLPTLAMLQTEKQQGLMGTRRRWMQQARLMLEILEAEGAFIEAMQGIPESELKAWKGNGGERDGGQAVLCLVRR